MANFKLKLKKPERSLDFDDSDLSEYQMSSSTDSPIQPASLLRQSSAVLPRSVPNHLLLISVLEELCFIYSRDTKQAQDIFKSLCDQLSKLNVVAPLLMLDEMSSLRSVYRHSVNVMVMAAVNDSNKRLFLQNGIGPKNLKALPCNIPAQPSNFPEEVVNQTSRYREEFVEVEKIGKGGFGSVFKSRNKLDGKLYAVKKVKFKHVKPDVWYRVLREVKALANLQHYNIVGYNAAWLEYGPSKPVYKRQPSEPTFSDGEYGDSIIFCDTSLDCDLPGLRTGLKITELSSDNTDTGAASSCLSGSPLHSPRRHKSQDGHNSYKEDFFQYTWSSSTYKSTEVIQSGHDTIEKIETTESYASKVEFTLDDTGTSGHWEDTDGFGGPGRVRRRSGFRRSISCDPHASGEIIFSSGKETKDVGDFVEESFPMQKTVTLYIQMELCSRTLKDWMEARNDGCKTTEEFINNQDQNMSVFRQILKAVDYMHSQGVIHRDLKPRNIFLMGDGPHVKVGDFGLATNDVFASTPVSENPDPQSGSCVSNLSRTASVLSTTSDHTSGVGTSTYAAPEQLCGSVYDTKCDIYSLGVILFELFQCYSTEMERLRSLENFRNGLIPDEMMQHWPIQAEHVDMMTCEHPGSRPSVKDLLSGELFMSKDQVIDGLRKEVETLKVLLSQKEKLIEKKDATIASLLKEFKDLNIIGTSV